MSLKLRKYPVRLPGDSWVLSHTPGYNTLDHIDELKRALEAMLGREITEAEARRLEGAKLNGLTEKRDLRRGKRFIELSLYFELPLAQ